MGPRSVPLYVVLRTIASKCSMVATMPSESFSCVLNVIERTLERMKGQPPPTQAVHVVKCIMDGLLHLAETQLFHAHLSS